MRMWLSNYSYDVTKTLHFEIINSYRLYTCNTPRENQPSLHLLSFLKNKLEMLIVAVLITSFVVLSSAQSSSECAAAYSATFFSTDDEATTCVQAYKALLNDNATNEQAMMVCNTGQQCNTMIENIITQCGNTVSFNLHIHYGYNYFS